MKRIKTKKSVDKKLAISMDFSIVGMNMAIYFIAMIFTIYFLMICEGKSTGPSYLRKSQKMDIMRKLEDVELTKVSFVFTSCFATDIDPFYLVSNSNIAIIERETCKFCKYVYTYKGTYDKTSKTYSFSNIVLDEKKSSFYLEGTYCSLKDNEYTYAELKGCAKAKEYVESFKFAKPSKLVEEDNKFRFYLEGKAGCDTFDSCIL